MKVLVTGCSGLLGSALCVLFRESFETYGTYSSHKVDIKDCNTAQLDITNARQTSSFIKKLKPEIVVHTAALVGVNACDKSPKIASKINVKGAENVLSSASKSSSKLIYISTDYVFDGKKGIYTEEDSTNPINHYGKTKLEGEQTAEKFDSCIIRTAIHGWNIFPERQSFSSWVVDALKNKKVIDVFEDQFNSMIFVNNLAEVIKEAVEKDKKGIYHIAGSERMSKARFSMKIADIFDLDSSLINPVRTREELLATRPLDVSLDISKAKKEFTTKILNAGEGITMMKDAHDKGYLKNFRV